MRPHATGAWSSCKAVGSERFKLLYDIYHMQIMEGDVIAHDPAKQRLHRPLPHRRRAGPARDRRDAGAELPADHAGRSWRPGSRGMWRRSSSRKARPDRVARAGGGDLRRVRGAERRKRKVADWGRNPTAPPLLPPFPYSGTTTRSFREEMRNVTGSFVTTSPSTSTGTSSLLETATRFVWKYSTSASSVWLPMKIVPR